MAKLVVLILAIVLVPSVIVAILAWLVIRSAGNTADEWNKIAAPLLAGIGTSALISGLVSVYTTSKQVEANRDLEKIKQHGARALQNQAH